MRLRSAALSSIFSAVVCVACVDDASRQSSPADVPKPATANSAQPGSVLYRDFKQIAPPPSETASTRYEPNRRSDAALESMRLSADGFGRVRIGMSPGEAANALGRTLVVADMFEGEPACQMLYVEGQPHSGFWLMSENGVITRVSAHGSYRQFLVTA